MPRHRRQVEETKPARVHLEHVIDAWARWLRTQPPVPRNPLALDAEHKALAEQFHTFRFLPKEERDKWLPEDVAASGYTEYEWQVACHAQTTFLDELIAEHTANPYSEYLTFRVGEHTVTYQLAGVTDKDGKLVRLPKR